MHGARALASIPLAMRDCPYLNLKLQALCDAMRDCMQLLVSTAVAAEYVLSR